MYIGGMLFKGVKTKKVLELTFGNKLSFTDHI